MSSLLFTWTNIFFCLLGLFIFLRYVYDYARNRVLSQSGAGLGIEEAKVWHRRAYGGLVRIPFISVQQLPPLTESLHSLILPSVTGKNAYMYHTCDNFAS